MGAHELDEVGDDPRAQDGVDAGPGGTLTPRASRRMLTLSKEHAGPYEPYSKWLAGDGAAQLR
jgi:hypothetical protein